MEYLIVIGAILALVGIIGSILPSIPGPTLSFVALLLLFFAKGAETIPVSSLVIFGVVTLLLILLDYLAPIVGAKYFGATKLGIIGAVLGLLLGATLLFPWGIVIGPFVGAMIGEMSGGKKLGLAMRAGIGTILGSVAMVVFQTAFSIFIASYFFLKLF